MLRIFFENKKGEGGMKVETKIRPMYIGPRKLQLALPRRPTATEVFITLSKLSVARTDTKKRK